MASGAQFESNRTKVRPVEIHLLILVLDSNYAPIGITWYKSVRVSLLFILFFSLIFHSFLSNLVTLGHPCSFHRDVVCDFLLI